MAEATTAVGDQEAQSESTNATTATDAPTEQSDAAQTAGTPDADEPAKPKPKRKRRTKKSEAPASAQEIDDAQADEQAPADDADAAPSDESPPAADADDQPEPEPKRKRSGKKARADKPDKPSKSDKPAKPGAAAGEKVQPNSLAARRMLINYVPGDECRVAVTVDGKLEEIHTEFASSESIVGNIYVGRVSNVEASIQAAFIDFGHHTNGFLHISDLHPQYFPGEDADTTERIGKKTPRRERPAIQQCLKKGQRVTVQVIKEGINTKGPTLSSYLSIPGRYLVMLPDMDRVGVSRKVEDEDVRKKMRQILDQLELPEGYGFIVRTAGLERTKTELKRDLAYLQRLRKDIDRRLRKGGDRPRLLYAESDLMMRTLRDLWTSDVDEIIIDNERAAARAARFMKIVSPRTSTRLLQYDRHMPMFWTYGVEQQIKQILARQVPLPSGGSLVIDETEAIIAIDVNSGRMRSNQDAESTAYKTNLEAVPEICRQLKLRDVGGLVICDLIDMMKRSNRKQIEQLFRDCLKSDRAATKVLPISQFGIVEMTRQRMKGSMRSQHFDRTREGGPMVRRPDSIAREAIRELARLLAVDRVHTVELVISPRLAGEFLSNRRQALTRLEARTEKHVDVRVSESISADRVVFYAYDERRADIEIDRLPKPSIPKDLIEWEIGSAGDADEDIQAELEAERREEREALSREAADTEESDSVLDALESDDDEFESESGDDESREGGRRRRRRRRRGRGGRADDSPRDDEHATTQTARDDATSGDDDTTPEGDRSGRRRRRRRRGTGDTDAGDKTPIGDAPPHAESFVRDQRKVFRLKDGEAPPKDQIGRPPLWRGDSWDLEPGELGALAAKPANPDNIVMPGAPARSGVNGSPRPREDRRGRKPRIETRLTAPGVDRDSAAPEPIADRPMSGARFGPIARPPRKPHPIVRPWIATTTGRRLPRLGLAGGAYAQSVETPATPGGGRSPRRLAPNALLTLSQRLRVVAEKRARARSRRRGGSRRR